MPYAGLPVIVITLLLMCLGRMESFVLFRYEMIIVFGYVAAILDLRMKRIPNSLVLAMFTVWVFIITPALFIDIGAAVTFLKDSALGFFIGGGLFLLVYIISRKGLGGGDVKFIAAAGMYLGFDGVVQTILFGTVLAALTGLSLVLLKKIGRKDSIPLAPFLFIGILTTVLLRGMTI